MLFSLTDKGNTVQRPVLQRRTELGNLEKVRKKIRGPAKGLGYSCLCCGRRGHYWLELVAATTGSPLSDSV